MARMPELDFIEVIEGKPLTREEADEIRELIRKCREARSKANVDQIEPVGKEDSGLSDGTASMDQNRVER
jgi:hypothetical protein